MATAEPRAAAAFPAGPQAAQQPRTAGQREIPTEADRPTSDISLAGLSPTPAESGPESGGGRTSGEPQESRSIRATTRFSPTEWELVQRGAAALRVSPSQLTREVLLGVLDGRRDRLGQLEAAASVPAPQPELAQAVEQLRRVGANLNQEVRRRHSGEGDDEELSQRVQEVAEAVAEVREHIGDRMAV